MSAKLWGGRFEKNLDETLGDFGASIHFDRRLWEEDILGSLAHIKGLLDAKLLPPKEADMLSEGLRTIKDKIMAGSVEFSTQDEDIHMNIERLLHQEIGPVAGKVHTGRSRNDQVALDMRLYMRKQLIGLLENCCLLQQSLITQAKKHLKIIVPGYTHLQRAHPVRLSQHWLAYVWMFFRDIERLKQNFKNTNWLPLGAGALAGSSFSVSQEYVADLLNFDGIYFNSMDAVSDRDYLVEFLSYAALIMMHLSKLCEELILWSSQEFAFIELDDAFCTGSSMMPQKKNPDCAELIRGKTGRVYGSLMSLLTVLKGLPLSYNKDLQEDKEGVFDTLLTVNNCLLLMAKMIATLRVNQENIKKNLDDGFLIATELANYLTIKGIPFREAHEIIGKMVKHCITENLRISDLGLSGMRKFSELFEQDALSLLSVKNVVERQGNFCGTAEDSVIKQIQLADNYLSAAVNWQLKAKGKFGKT
jgi:argininosuccinate lyase